MNYIYSDYVKNNILDVESMTQYILEPNDNYASMLILFNKNDNKLYEFMDMYSSKLQLLDDGNRICILNNLLRVIGKLDKPKKFKLTKLIWSFQGFRDIIPLFKLESSGSDYRTKSIFSNIINDEFLVDFDELLDIFDSIIKDNSIREFLINYLDHIFTTNIAYTYDNPEYIKLTNCSSFDFCFLCLIILIKLLNNDDKSISNHLFWKAVHISYFSIARMMNDIVNHMKIYTTNISSHDLLDDLNRDHTMIELRLLLNRLGILGSYHMTEEIDLYIMKRYDWLITNNINSDDDNSKKNDILLNLCSNYSHRTNSGLIKINGFIKNVANTIISPSVPSLVKFNFMRLVISHNLNIFNIFNIDKDQIHDSIIKYLLNDIPKLEEPIITMHYVDIITYLKLDKLFENIDFILIYMNLIPSFNSKYIDILKLFNQSHNSDANRKPYFMKNIGNMVNLSIDLIKMLPGIGKLSKSYIKDLLYFIDTIICTKEIIETDDIVFNKKNFIK
jgi:hypothetical protein